MWEIYCESCATKGYKHPYFQTGNTVCPVCLDTAPAYVDPLSGLPFIPSLRADIEATAKQFNIDTIPINTDEYAEALVSLDLQSKHVARQLKYESKTRTQSIYQAVKGYAEGAVSHRFLFVTMGNTKPKKLAHNYRLTWITTSSCKLTHIVQHRRGCVKH